MSLCYNGRYIITQEALHDTVTIGSMASGINTIHLGGYKNPCMHCGSSGELASDIKSLNEKVAKLEILLENLNALLVKTNPIPTYLD